MAEPAADMPAPTAPAPAATSSTSAVSYSLVGSYFTVQVLSPTEVVNIESTTIQTQPSGVIASYPVLKETFDAGDAGTVLSRFASSIEAVMTDSRVVAAVGNPSRDDNGLLQYNVAFTVRYVDTVLAPYGATSQVTIPVGLLYFSDSLPAATQHAAVIAQIDAVYANLKASAGG